MTDARGNDTPSAGQVLPASRAQESPSAAARPHLISASRLPAQSASPSVAVCFSCASVPPAASGAQPDRSTAGRPCLSQHYCVQVAPRLPGLAGAGACSPAPGRPAGERGRCQLRWLRGGWLPSRPQPQPQPQPPAPAGRSRQGPGQAGGGHPGAARPRGGTP